MRKQWRRASGSPSCHETKAKADRSSPVMLSVGQSLHARGSPHSLGGQSILRSWKRKVNGQHYADAYHAVGTIAARAEAPLGHLQITNPKVPVSVRTGSSADGGWRLGSLKRTPKRIVDPFF